MLKMIFPWNYADKAESIIGLIVFNKLAALPMVYVFKYSGKLPVIFVV